MRTIVLVHGSWLGAWCWNSVADILRESGATVLAQDLPGHGADTTPATEATLDSYVHQVTKTIAQQAQPVVLVGHSMGGIVLSSVAEKIPAHVAQLVYVSAYLLESGQSIMQASALDADSEIPANLVLAADYSTASIPAAKLQHLFCADADPADSAALVSQATPEPAGPFGVPILTTAANFGSVPRAYVRTEHDRVISPAFQSLMLSKTPCDPILSLPSSHTPFFAHAPELAKFILGFAQ